MFVTGEEEEEDLLQDAVHSPIESYSISKKEQPLRKLHAPVIGLQQANEIVPIPLLTLPTLDMLETALLPALEMEDLCSHPQIAEQPSPLMVFPSSHSSLPTEIQSPQIVSQTSPEREETEEEEDLTLETEKEEDEEKEKKEDEE
ncbi:hypothetical protein A3H22_00230 [Candidatus Peribacteria bacterium RIFCSPLOWO2_12_FULL_55_15]|nr:MAG: hypothetical protein A2789_01225 [Candidatus Peribacteria bacterium RIFCSPHIGHO2_01_FULL_54_22]OGJ63122.1 MAG: hypothetical protein A3D12_02780 [Candidatus Peribacteria bacterium RIFCSPHIGHO2_02_FULL_55_24]OGJ64406.1 MAG: hypothetical protein A3E47_02865 [Candidatus Peribacteria bacterium RIFCSPHIGHO2_12_FULL_54_10]OGJ67668.1 MAG: hypothetical protein A2947_00735 [Candidatus Peribacteria bacterium RIFCSPLOWO2_01_FULL_54_110]OGJ70184.1 MAG: hypothetical protein A3H90_00570 [Candidatus Pe